MVHAMIRIVLYSPDQKLHPLLSSALKPECTIIAQSGKEGLKRTVGGREADILILDFDSNYSTLPQQLALYEEVAAECQIPVVVMSDDLNKSTALEFIQRGAFDVIRKPPSLLEIKVTVRRAHEHAAMKAELERMRGAINSTTSCDRLVGTSGRAQAVYDLIRRVTNLNAFVLITGESGTGKELVARAIHNLGNRAKHPFVAVSCGAIPESLIEAELFGHEKGAFTGSTGTRAGYLEQAQEGTLFLDEIGELSQNTQVKLLRVLQQKEFSRLGSNKLIPLKARVIFATHRNLERMVEEGTFRRDLFFRVNVMPIHVPPIRERTEDIPMLARHLLAKYTGEYGKDVHDIRPDAMEALVEHSWPGNIRELENVIQSAVIRADDGRIGLNDLPEHIRQLSQELLPLPDVEAESFDDLVRHYKINLAHKTLNECDGNKTLAARKLKLSRAYLHRLIRGTTEEVPTLDEPSVVRLKRAPLASAS
jgi:DNA-binding NtrC family response regulator